VCLFSRDDLANPDATIIYRSQGIMMGHLERYQNHLADGFKAAADLITHEESFHPFQPCIWDFRGNETIDGNGYRCIMVEHMHQADLGIQQHLVLCLRKAVGKRVCRKLDRRLNVIISENNICGFRLPVGNYFMKFKNIQAHEHRCVLQVLCICLQGMIEEKFSHVFKSYYEWYIHACRKPSYTQCDIDHLHILTKKLISEMVTVFGDYQKSNFKLNKVHAMLHYAEDIKRGGPTSQYSANLWEHLHIHRVKAPYRASNSKDTSKQIFDANTNTELLDELDDYGIEDKDDISDDRKTSAQQKV
jgi:hypothetical protein